MLITITASVSHSFLSFFYSSPRTLIFSFLLNKLSLRSSFLPFPSFGRRRHQLHSQPMALVSANTMNTSSQKLENPEDLIDSVETFMFDCNGVVWKGDKLIDGVPETLDILRSKGKRFVFLTNNSTKSQKQYGKKLETLGLNVREEGIFASSFAAAAYLKSIDFPKDKKVYVISEDGILKELELAGFQSLGGPVWNFMHT